MLKLIARQAGAQKERGLGRSRPRPTRAHRGFDRAAGASPEADLRSGGIELSATMTDRAAHRLARISVSTPAPRAIQAKLSLSRPGDAGEREAERVADEVMRMQDGLHRQADRRGSSVAQATLQRACSCGGEAMSDEGEMVRRAPDPSLPTIDQRIPPDRIERNPFAGSEPVEETSPGAVAAAQDQAIAAQRTARGGMAEAGLRATAGSGIARSIDRASRGGGRPLTLAARRFMEPRFGHAFGAVRIHADRAAGELARQLQARAFTTGNRIFFAPGEYQPERTSGRRLLAHELTHVVQQSAGGPGMGRQIQRAKSGCLNCQPYCSYDRSADLATYNCAGLAHRTYDYKSLAATKAILAKGASISCGTPCDHVGVVKHWLWEFDSHIEDSSGKVLPQPVNGVMVDSWHDFHTVAGPTAGDPVAKESDEFFSKDGQRPVYGPATAPSFRPPARAQATYNAPDETPGVDASGKPIFKVNSNMTEECYCFPCPKPKKSP